MENTHQRFAITFLCGPPGTGKSYYLVQDVIKRLINSDVRIITNLPLKLDVVSEHVARKRGCEPEEIIERLHLLGGDVLSVWKAGKGGPWELAREGLAEGSELILDECHLFCPKKNRGRMPTWEAWLGESRHEGWRRLVFVTQDEAKVGQPIVQHAELRYELTNSERLRDPFFRIPNSYWFELKASITREYTAPVVVQEFRRVGGKLVAQKEGTSRFELKSEGFRFYESYSAPGGGSKEGGAAAEVHEFEKRPALWIDKAGEVPMLPVWLWLVTNNKWKVARTMAIVLAFGWLTVGGGASWLIAGLPARIVARMGEDGSARPEDLEHVGTHNVERLEDVEGMPKVNREKVSGPKATDLAAAISRIEDEGLREDLVRGLFEVRDELTKREEEIQQQREKIEELKYAEMVDVRLVSVEDAFCRLSDGTVLYRGSKLRDSGGVKVVQIHRPTREVLLSDGRVLRLGGVLRYRAVSEGSETASGEGVAGSNVPRAVSAIPARTKTGTEGRSGKAREHISSGDADRGVRSVLVRSNGRERDSRSGARSSKRDVGGPQPTPAEPPSNGGASAGGKSHPER